MQIQFYHLLTTPLEVALPKLAEMAVAKEMRCVVVADDAMIDILDKSLWTFSQNSFVPHLKLSECEADHAKEQPILLHNCVTDENNPELCMVTNDRYFEELPKVSRIFDIFNGNDSGATEKARERWSAYKARNIHLTYVKQQDNGAWKTEMNVNAPDAQ